MLRHSLLLVAVVTSKSTCLFEFMVSILVWGAIGPSDHEYEKWLAKERHIVNKCIDFSSLVLKLTIYPLIYELKRSTKPRTITRYAEFVNRFAKSVVLKSSREYNEWLPWFNFKHATTVIEPWDIRVAHTNCVYAVPMKVLVTVVLNIDTSACSVSRS